MNHFFFYTTINGVLFGADDLSAVESFLERQVQDYRLKLIESDGDTMLSTVDDDDEYAAAGEMFIKRFSEMIGDDADEDPEEPDDKN